MQGAGKRGCTYVGREYGVAGRGRVHRHGEAEGPGPQVAVLQHREPLRRGRGQLEAGTEEGGEGPGRGGQLTVKPTGVSRAAPGRGWQLT